MYRLEIIRSHAAEIGTLCRRYLIVASVDERAKFTVTAFDRNRAKDLTRDMLVFRAAYLSDEQIVNEIDAMTVFQRDKAKAAHVGV